MNQVKKMTVKDKDGNTITQEFDIPKMLDPQQAQVPQAQVPELMPMTTGEMQQQGLDYMASNPGVPQQQAQPVSQTAYNDIDEFSHVNVGDGRVPFQPTSNSVPKPQQQVPLYNDIDEFADVEVGDGREKFQPNFAENLADDITELTGGVISVGDSRDRYNGVVPKTDEVPGTEEPEQKALSVLAQTVNDEQSVNDEAAIDQVDDEDQKNAGDDLAEKEPGMFQKVLSALGNAAQGLLNEGDLAEAAIMYLGSRALGYSHGGSLRWTGKRYLGQQLEHKKKVQQLHEANTHTEESVEIYKQSRDAKDLVPITQSSIKVDRTNPTLVQDRKTGKQIKAYVAQDKTGNKVFVNASGKPISAEQYETDPYRVKGSKEYNERQYKAQSVAADTFKSLQKQFGTLGEGEDKRTFTDLNPRTAAHHVGQWAASNNIDPNEAGVLLDQAYADMRNYANASGKRPSDIRPFLNQLVIRNRTGTPELFEAKGSTPENPQWVDAGKMTLLNNKVADVMKMNKVEGNVSDIANLFMNKKIQQWTGLKPEVRDKYNAMANDHESGFYVFVADKLGVDRRENK